MQHMAEMADSIREAALSPAGRARALPFAAYTDPDVHRLEMDRIFGRDWIAICASASLANPGDHFAHAIGGEPVVVLRGDDGKLRALSNVCRHRGTLLQDDGFGAAKKFVCPYHAWTYDLEGNLRGVPVPGNVEIDKSAHCLPQFRVEEWAGVVFVNLDASAESLASRLVGLERYLDPFDMSGFDTPTPPKPLETWDANWKLIVENGIESYHLFKVHRDTLETMTPTKGAFYLEGSARWTATAGWYKGVDPTASAEHPTAGLVGKGYVLVSIPPSFVAILTEDSWGWLSVFPTAADRTVVAEGSLRRGRPSLLERASKAVEENFVTAFLAEDRAICERGQRGMAARRSQGGQLVELERVVADFHHHLAWRLFGAEPAAAWRGPAAEAGTTA